MKEIEPLIQDETVLMGECQELMDQLELLESEESSLMVQIIQSNEIRYKNLE